MSKIKALGQLLLLNLFLNSKVLNNIWKNPVEHPKTRTILGFFSDKEIYSRLLSSIEFDKLSQRNKDEFLFKRYCRFNGISDDKLYSMALATLAQEAHNRTCRSLGVKPTRIRIGDFEKSGLNEDGVACYDILNDEIFLNIKKIYSQPRPSLLLETINSCTFEHAVYNSMITALQDSEKVDDKLFFIDLITATRVYVMEQMKEYNSNEEISQLRKEEVVSPLFLTQALYSFSKTRSDFQSAEIYGGKIQAGLRKEEVSCCNKISEIMLGDSLISMEDLIGYFEGTDLNQESNGFFGKIFKSVVNTMAPKFYNYLGADMEDGETITHYVNSLENELFEKMGIEKPSDKEDLEIDEDYDGDDEFQGEDEDLDEYKDDENNLDTDDEENSFTEDDAQYRSMRNILPDEGKVFKVQHLPFSEDIFPTQGEQQSQQY